MFALTTWTFATKPTKGNDMSAEQTPLDDAPRYRGQKSYMIDFLDLAVMEIAHYQGVTNAELAKRSGINRSTIGRYFRLQYDHQAERGGTRGADLFVGRMAKALDVTPMYIWEMALAKWRADPAGKGPQRVRRREQAKREAAMGGFET